MKEPKNLLPGDISTKRDFMGSDFRNSESEAIARNIVIIQKAMNPDAWMPFSFEEYKKRCSHRVTSSDEGVLYAFVHGGRPVAGTSTILDRGYLKVDEEGRYYVTVKFLEIISKFASA
ncbi:MAG: hypothetical protein Q7R64_02940 [bacterium]|nr:hypothetical protein [bacterium]